MRGWFAVGGELTSGIPDRKEGLYLGQELSDDHPRVAAKVPLHGRNLYPENPADLGKVIVEYQRHMSEIGKALLRGIALGLGMSEDWFAETICREPTELFRLFHYPPPDLSNLKEGEHPGWGVGEHTDYGLLTILAQDDCGGLQVKLPGNNWIDVIPEPSVYVCNIGDMLDKLTEGRYRSTPHRVLNASGRQRVSFPFFVDPSWDAEVTALPLEGSRPADDVELRWDGKSVHTWSGLYGDYLVNKVSKIFP